MTKILIAEDDEKIAQLEQDYLESNGYETKIIKDGARVTILPSPLTLPSWWPGFGLT